MNKQIIIMLIAACTTALWGVVHSIQPANMTTTQMPTNNAVPTTMAMPATPNQSTPVNLPTLALSHFENIDTTEVEAILNEAKGLTNKFKIHAEIESVYLNHIRIAFEAGLRTGFMVAGQYMQAGLNGMGNKIKAMTMASQTTKSVGSN